MARGRFRASHQGDACQGDVLSMSRGRFVSMSTHVKGTFHMSRGRFVCHMSRGRTCQGDVLSAMLQLPKGETWGFLFDHSSSFRRGNRVKHCK